RYLLTSLLATLFVVALGRAQDAAPKPLDPSALKALELDKTFIAAAKQDSEIIKNLSYLADVIGPRLTGSAALARANEWTAARMRNYGLSNVHLEPWSMPEGWQR